MIFLYFLNHVTVLCWYLNKYIHKQYLKHSCEDWNCDTSDVCLYYWPFKTTPAAIPQTCNYTTCIFIQYVCFVTWPPAAAPRPGGDAGRAAARGGGARGGRAPAPARAARRAARARSAAATPRRATTPAAARPTRGASRSASWVHTEGGSRFKITSHGLHGIRMIGKHRLSASHRLLHTFNNA